MSKHMSRTMATEIADRVLAVVNPANRPMALAAVLQRHGFGGVAVAASELPQERAALVGWLRERFGSAG